MGDYASTIFLSLISLCAKQDSYHDFTLFLLLKLAYAYQFTFIRPLIIDLWKSLVKDFVGIGFGFYKISLHIDELLLLLVDVYV